MDFAKQISSLPCAR